MAKAAVATAIPVDDAAAPKSKKKLLILAAAGVVALAAAGGGAWFFLSKDSGGHAKAAKAHEPPAPPVFMPAETFTVNLMPEGEEQYLQVSLVVQVKNQEASDKVKLYMPQLRSRLLMLLSGKKASEITSIEGKNKLSEEIVAQIKQPFAQGEKSIEVAGVHFTDFIIQ